jgi:gliding motility-associated-like protein
MKIKLLTSFAATLTTLAVCAQPVIQQIDATDDYCQNGTITVTATGGTAPLLYSLDGFVTSQTSPVFQGLSYGTYTVYVKDANGVQAQSPTNTAVVANQVLELIQDPITTAATCYNTPTGTATLRVKGGIPYGDTQAYKLLLTRNNAPISSHSITFTTTADYVSILIDQLPQGTYVGTLQDKGGCTLGIQFNITAPDALTAQITNIQNVPCHGGNDGQIQCMVNGGTAPYTLSAYTDINDPNSTVASTQATTSGAIALTDLSAGTYYLQLTDQNGCQWQAEATITQPAEALQYQPYANSINCSGQTSGKVFGEAQGGTLPYAYQLTGVNIPYQSNANNTGLFEGLAMGVYSAKVTDGNGCVFSPTELITISESETLTVDKLTKIPAATVVCPEHKTASVTFTVAGRVQPVAPSDTARYYSVRLFDITRQQEIIVPNLTFSNRFHPVLTEDRIEEVPVLLPDGTPQLDNLGNEVKTTITVTDTLWAEGCHEPTKAEEVFKVSGIDYTEDLKGFDCDDKITVSGLGAGAYSIQFYQGDCQFGETLTFTVEVTGSVPQVQINNVANFCDGSAYTIKPTIQAYPGISKYEWTLGDVAVGNSGVLNHTFAQAENGQLLQLTATNACGSTTSNQVKVTVRQRPTAVLKTDKDYLCQNQAANLSVTFKGTAPFTYQFPDEAEKTTQQAGVSEVVTPLETTVYTLAALQDAYCQANIEQDIENTRITVYPQPDYGMEVAIPTPMVSGKYVTITATEGFVAYYLQVNGEPIAAGEKPNQFATKKFVYGTSDNEFALQITDTNGCEWALSEIHTVTSELFPNIFTPNGDGVNDVLLEGYNLRVFDRQGNLVFAGTQGWDGTIAGKPANQGIYLYTVEIADANGETFVHKMTLTLER